MAGWSVQWLAHPSPPKTCHQLDLNLLLFPPHSPPQQTRQTPPSWLTGTNVSLLDCILIFSNAHSQSLLQARVPQLDFGDHLQGPHAHHLGAVRRRLRLLHRSLASRWPHDPQAHLGPELALPQCLFHELGHRLHLLDCALCPAGRLHWPSLLLQCGHRERCGERWKPFHHQQPLPLCLCHALRSLALPLGRIDLGHQLLQPELALLPPQHLPAFHSLARRLGPAGLDFCCALLERRLHGSRPHHPRCPDLWQHLHLGHSGLRCFLHRHLQG